MTQYLGRIKMGLAATSAGMCGRVGVLPGRDWKQQQRVPARQGCLAAGVSGVSRDKCLWAVAGGWGPWVPSNLRAVLG